MPEYLRALLVIIVLASALFFAAEKPCLAFVGPTEFKRWRNTWLATTIVAFLCQNFWLYVLVTGLLTYLLSAQYKNRTASFLLLLSVIPALKVQVPGFGLINYFFEFNQPRLLALLLLLPCVLTANRSAGSGGKVSDALVLSYLLLDIALQIRQTTITDTMRYAFHTFLDAALPYFAFSRSLKDLHAFRHTLLCFVLACMVISLVAVFEFSKGWLLYSSLIGVLGLGQEGGYMARSYFLRASGPTGNPIALGYTIMVAIGFYLFLMNSLDSVLRRRAGLMLLVSGLLASLSRGPWLGTVVLIGVYVSTGRAPIRHLVVLGIAGVVGLATLTIIPGGDKILDLLPYIGTVEAHTIEFRETLFTNSLIVIQRNPWFGSIDYLQSPEMQELRVGQGIIDITNNYLQIALSTGVVGLFFFVAIFVSSIVGVWRAMASIKLRTSDEYVLGSTLLASTMAILFTIATVSNIGNVPIIYWSVVGMSVAYARMVRSLRSADRDLTQNRLAARAQVKET